MVSINNPKFGNYIVDIYPAELEIKDTTDADHRASYLDLDLSYDRDKRLQVNLYDKRDDFNGWLMVDGFNGMSTHLGHVMPKRTVSKTMEKIRQ